MKSPGAPSLRREVQREFWREIAKGLTSEDAGVAVGASPAAGSRWFRERGGMAPFDLSPLSGRYLSFREREEIALLRAQNVGISEIGRQLGRHRSTISRELRRNAATRGGRLDYRASVAQWKAELLAQRPKPAKLVANTRLHDYVQERLAGQVRRPDGTAVTGPPTQQWKGRNKPRRQDRQWATAWSPEQISHRLRVDFPDDGSMRISHEAIYQALYVQGRGALKRELVACLRTGRALRVPAARAHHRPAGHVTPGVMISERPAEVADRAVPGHWEGDLIIGTDRSAIGTLVERASRFTMLLHLPRQEGWGIQPRVKNGPPLAGLGAEAMRTAIAARMTTMPDQLRRSLTWDRGKELAQHVQLSIDTGIAVYFADPHSPWQRGTNENTNGLLRQYFPKGTDLSRWNADELDAVAATLNSRPRKSSTGRHPRKPSPGGYRPPNRPVLRRPVESGLLQAFARTAHLGGSERTYYRVDYPEATLVVLDSLDPGRGGGRLGTDQLAWLDQELSRRPAVSTFVGVHHPPVPVGIPFLDSIGLDDGPALAEVVRAHPQVVRVLSGHVHRPVTAAFAGTILTTAPSTYRQSSLTMLADRPIGYLAEPTGLLLHQLIDTGCVTHTVPVSHAAARLGY
jgi:IS30 family transposase